MRAAPVDGIEITPDGFAVRSRATMECVCAKMVAAQDPHLPLFRAVADGRIALFTLDGPEAKWPSAELATISRPVVILVGDDPAPIGQAVGPTAWHSAKRLKYWCKAAIIHGTGASHDHYAAAVLNAVAYQRLAFVETDSGNALAWRDYLACPLSLLLRPPAGAQHPDIRSAGPLQ